MTDRSADELDVVKLGRVYALIQRLLPELRTELDPACATRVEELTTRLLVEIGSAVPDALLRELGRIVRQDSDGDPTAAELRVIDAQLLGWLRGVARAELVEDLEPRGRRSGPSTLGAPPSRQR